MKPVSALTLAWIAHLAVDRPELAEVYDGGRQEQEEVRRRQRDQDELEVHQHSRECTDDANDDGAVFGPHDLASLPRTCATRARLNLRRLKNRTRRW